MSVFPPLPNLQLEKIMSKSIFKVIFQLKQNIRINVQLQKLIRKS